MIDPKLLDLTKESLKVADYLNELSSVDPEKLAWDYPTTKFWMNMMHRFLTDKKTYDTLAIARQVYTLQLQASADKAGTWPWKALPLVYISDSYWKQDCYALAKRFAMLAFIEEARVTRDGLVESTKGSYRRLSERHGMSDTELGSYGKEAHKLYSDFVKVRPEDCRYPEYVLLKMSKGWISEGATIAELGMCPVNPVFLSYLISKLRPSEGDKTATAAFKLDKDIKEGERLEEIAEYLMLSMAGTRTERRLVQKGGETDYDIVSSFAGPSNDFRSELGRYIICECKDRGSKGDFSDVAKFARVLTSINSSFGVFFATQGITGYGKRENAESEMLKLFQDSRIVIAAISLQDLKEVADGANFINILRQKYEHIRLDAKVK